ncbi:MAG: hypothetical protein J6A78_03965 [Clostridia bacterium]|nr:hypothetical protein [Clostridia bacterium]
MPDYKRKKRSHFSAKPRADKSRFKENKERKNKIKFDDGTDIPKKKNGFAVLKGNKAEIKKRWQTFFIAVLAVILVLVGCQLLMPAGLFETVQTLVLSMGGGSYPLEFESNHTENVVLKSNYYYVLTDSEVKVISFGGKEIFTYSHGFEKPVIKTSATRAIVFNQGGNDAVIFNLNKICSTINCEKEIINAAIGDDGTYALITSADSYVAAVSVYKKNDKLLYEWYSSSDMVNNVVIAPSGKKIAISTLSTNVGGFNSKLMILNFKSANAEFTKEYSGEIIYSLSAEYSRGVAVATANKYDFIRWNKYESRQYENEYNLQILRESNKGALLVYNRENDKTDNRIVIISPKGEVKHELEFSGIITDICLKNNHIYCISDTKAYILDMEGKIVRTADCGFGAVRFAVVSQNEIAVITDNIVSKVKFEQG